MLSFEISDDVYRALCFCLVIRAWGVEFEAQCQVSLLLQVSTRSQYSLDPKSKALNPKPYPKPLCVRAPLQLKATLKRTRIGALTGTLKGTLPLRNPLS